MADPTIAQIDGMAREEAEIVAARLLIEITRTYRVPLKDAMQITHLAARLEWFGQEARSAAA